MSSLVVDVPTRLCGYGLPHTGQLSDDFAQTTALSS